MAGNDIAPGGRLAAGTQPAGLRVLAWPGHAAEGRESVSA
jgi:hypothetical protein